jgi:Abortive infection alpha
MPDPISAALAKESLEPVKGLLQRVAGPLGDEVGESLALIARPYRIRLSLKMLHKTQRMLSEAGIAPQAVPPRLFLPMLEAASIESDEDLHTKWSALLTNAAASPGKVHPSYIEILKQLTPDDARFLDKLYIATNDTRFRQLKSLLGQDKCGIPFQNIVRLGLVQTTYQVDGMKVSMRHGDDPYVSGEMDEDHWLTDFAVGFIEACRAPKAI